VGQCVAGRPSRHPVSKWLPLLLPTRKPHCRSCPGQFQAGPQPAAPASPARKRRPRLLVAVRDAVSFVLLHQKGLGQWHVKNQLEQAAGHGGREGAMPHVAALPRIHGDEGRGGSKAVELHPATVPAQPRATAASTHTHTHSAACHPAPPGDGSEFLAHRLPQHPQHAQRTQPLLLACKGDRTAISSAAGSWAVCMQPCGLKPKVGSTPLLRTSRPPHAAPPRPLTIPTYISCRTHCA